MAIPNQIVCVSCGRTVPIRDFYMNYNFIHEEYSYSRMFHCKDCCRKISQKIMGKYWNSNSNHDDKISYSLGIRAICSFFHMPYIDKVMEKVRDVELTATKNKDWSYVYQYMKSMDACDIPREYWSNLAGNSFLSANLLKIASPTQDGDNELFEQLEADWGADYDRLEDYLILEESYSKYSKGERFNNAMENTVRRLCIAELDYRKAREKKEDAKVLQTIEKKIADYYKMLKLDDFKFAENKSAGELSLEKWTAIEETTRPLEVFDKLFAKDMCNIGKDYGDIMRCIGNLAIGKKDYPSLTEDDIKET
jgi:hypothetical protein